MNRARRFVTFHVYPFGQSCFDVTEQTRMTAAVLVEWCRHALSKARLLSRSDIGVSHTWYLVYDVGFTFYQTIV